MITSVRNPKIQWVRGLNARPRSRREEGAFVVEGVRLVEEAVKAAWKPLLVLYTDDLSTRGQQLIAELRAAGADHVEQVTPEVLRAASDTEAPQGVLAVLPLRSLPLPSQPNFVLILDAVQDPGNVGTILRTAAAAGVDAVLLAPGTADPFAPKVVRAAMGAHFRLPVHLMNWGVIRDYLARSPAIHIYLATAEEGKPYHRVETRGPLVLIIGSEVHGLSDEARELSDDRIHIPMPGGTESLNAAAAAAILLFEVVRQRMEARS